MLSATDHNLNIDFEPALDYQEPKHKLYIPPDAWASDDDYWILLGNKEDCRRGQLGNLSQAVNRRSPCNKLIEPCNVRVVARKVLTPMSL